MHILEEWRIRDVERKLESTANRLHELGSIRRDVDSLECANRKMDAHVDGLCSALEVAIDRIAALELRIQELTAL